MMAPRDLLFRESGERKINALRAELSGPNPSPLERLLVERVVATWLQAWYADASYAQAREQQTTPAILRELMRRQESSQRRYLASIKQLATVRKLLKPAPSVLELMSRPVDETAPASRGRATPATPLRVVRPSEVGEGQPVLN
jgi:hypothetical protein